jgi:hypothetical protein
MKTMWMALKLCLPITFMSFAIFTRSDMVVNPGWPQIVDTLLVTIASCGITFSIFGRFVEGSGANTFYRAALAIGSTVVMLHPRDDVAIALAVFVLPLTIFGVLRHRRIASPKVGGGNLDLGLETS